MEKLSVYILKEWLVFSNADESNVNVGKLKFFFIVIKSGKMSQNKFKNLMKISF